MGFKGIKYPILNSQLVNHTTPDQTTPDLTRPNFNLTALILELAFLYRYFHQKGASKSRLRLSGGMGGLS